MVQTIPLWELHLPAAFIFLSSRSIAFLLASSTCSSPGMFFSADPRLGLPTLLGELLRRWFPPGTPFGDPILLEPIVQFRLTAATVCSQPISCPSGVSSAFLEVPLCWFPPGVPIGESTSLELVVLCLLAVGATSSVCSQLICCLNGVSSFSPSSRLFCAILSSETIPFLSTVGFSNTLPLGSLCCMLSAAMPSFFSAV